MPRAGSIRTKNVAGGLAYEFLPEGYEQLKQLAIVGTPIAGAARFFGVSEDWLSKTIKTDPFAQVAWAAEMDGELEIRTALHETAKGGDARVLTFVAERRLGMHKVVEQKHDHVHRVIGAMPKYKLSAEEWAEQFAPKQLEAQPIDAVATPVNESEESSDA
jgi:hypothetical protein